MQRSKTVKVTLELNADQLHSLLTCFESKLNGPCEVRSIHGLASAMVLQAERFDEDDQNFAFETVATAEIYVRLLALLSDFPEIQGDFSCGLDAPSEKEYFHAYERVRTLLGIPAENSAAAIRRRRRDRVKEEKAAGALCSIVPFAEVAS